MVNNEPVVIASIIQALLAAAVAIGWLKIDSATVDSIATAVGAAIVGILAAWARSKVTPVKPPE